MLAVFICLLLGIIVGYLIRQHTYLSPLINKTINIFILGLVFFLGISVGINKKIVANLGTIGVKALILSLGAIIGSICFSVIIYKLFFKAMENKK